MSIKIENKDSLEYLKTLEDKSINLAIYDAPYFSTGIKEVGDKQWKNEKEYIDWCLYVIRETQRVLKDNGSFYWFHNDINIMVDILYRVKNETEFKLKNQITWDKLSTGNQDFLMPLYKNSKLKRKYATSLTEYIYYFTVNNDTTGLKQVMTDINSFKPLRNYSEKLQNYIGLSLKEINKKLKSRSAEHFFYHHSTQWDLCTQKTYDMLIKEFEINKWNEFKEYKYLKLEYDKLKKSYETKINMLELERYRFNQPYLITPKDIQKSRETIRPYSTVWNYSRNEDIYKLHITPKPLEMIKHIIEVSSNENDTVLDIFSGSGTTALASLITNRNFIGTDINKDYNNIAYDRINTYIKDNNFKNINVEIES